MLWNESQAVEKVTQPQNSFAVLRLRWLHLQISATYQTYTPLFASLAALTCAIFRDLTVVRQTMKAMLSLMPWRLFRRCLRRKVKDIHAINTVLQQSAPNVPGYPFEIFDFGNGCGYYSAVPGQCSKRAFKMCFTLVRASMFPQASKALLSLMPWGYLGAVSLEW